MKALKTGSCCPDCKAAIIAVPACLGCDSLWAAGLAASNGTDPHVSQFFMGVLRIAAAGVLGLVPVAESPE